ncbi:unnamed protein product [Candidula unifasciata]|uniref:Glycosyltransferase family 92 protein n=1 Tax=Candidula unifasciata TaxID=100452 RepID=A0A8S3YTG2_9EUPU|nr:unnamed protein product [Candidula unifasciata]
MKNINTIIAVCIFVILFLSWNWIFVSMSSALVVYQKWSQQLLPAKIVSVKPFVLSRSPHIYMYSAFVHLPGEADNTADSNTTTSIVITTLGKTRVQLFCCILFRDKKTLQVVTADLYHEYGYYDNEPKAYIARQFICRVPVTSDFLRDSYVTLSSTICSNDLQGYIPILHPTRVPGGIAICGKIAHSGGLDPEKTIEWFEVQRLLGVDKILIFDLGNPETIKRVFRYYQNLGILDLQPYELPGEPQNRSLADKFIHTEQFDHDETMPVLECRQRLAGYDYIMGHDADEFIIPRQNVTLKEFLKEQMQKEPNAAGFYFYTQFFVTTWGPTNPEEDLIVKRYRKSTEPLWRAYKYVYQPSRVKSAMTHEFFATSEQFNRPKVATSEAVLHHYRRCPTETLGDCTGTTIIDDTMTRFHDLEQRVAIVRTATFTNPNWTISEG